MAPSPAAAEQIRTTNHDFDIVSELSCGRMPDLFQRKLGRTSRIVARTKSLVMMPTVSPLLVGHLLVFSLSEDVSFANTIHKNFSSFAELSDLIANYEAQFGPSFIFEHGSSESSPGACGVSRAHIHLIPANATKSFDIVGKLSEELGLSETLSLDEFPIALVDQEYLVVGSRSSAFNAWKCSNIPSQIIRRLLSTHLGLKQWNWNELFGWGVVDRTLASWPSQN